MGTFIGAGVKDGEWESVSSSSFGKALHKMVNQIKPKGGVHKGGVHKGWCAKKEHKLMMSEFCVVLEK